MAITFEQVDYRTIDVDVFHNYADKLIFQTKEWIGFLEKTQNAKPVVLKIFEDGNHIGFFSGLLLGISIGEMLADCGYTSARQIIQEVIRQMHLPPKLSYPFVKLGARLFGGFDPDSGSAIEAAEKIRVPVIFYHGTADDFVPCAMSEKLYAACKCRKRLVKVPNAGHGLAFPVDQEMYLQTLKEFFQEELG